MTEQEAYIEVHDLQRGAELLLELFEKKNETVTGQEVKPQK